ncbi:MAG: MBL fold metallo-hydrolase [Lachnospiraceae bacterium]|nr:MBL fold metallo-hydrolase [Oscillospiraceae bacterium]MDY5542074.1 MBL fold metallo-hydrolase [Lachnospiraceae bacterium]
MGKSKVERVLCGSVGTNCYFLINTQTQETVIIDPADDAPMLSAKLKEKNLKPAAILLTHGHYDHIMAVEELRKEYGIPVIAHEEEKQILENPKGNLSTMIGMPFTVKADRFVKDEELLVTAGFSIRVLHTPGHTIGGCCYYLADENLLFSGDTLFWESVGRTDFPTGSMSALVRSIKEKLMVLPESTRVYPGHMGSTSIENEKQNNPFL